MGVYTSHVENCQTCGKEVRIRGTRKAGVFCSSQCRAERRMVPCVVCGNKFKKYREDAKVCSVQCRTILLTRREVVCCAWCGKSFERVPVRVARAAVQFCGPVCQSAEPKLRNSMREIQRAVKKSLRERFLKSESRQWAVSLWASYARQKPVVTNDWVKCLHRRMRASRARVQGRKLKAKRRPVTWIEWVSSALRTLKSDQGKNSCKWSQWSVNTASNMRKRRRRKHSSRHRN